MAKHALHKKEDIDRIERKLQEGGQILPFGPPELAVGEEAIERFMDALADSNPKERSEMLDRLYHAATGQMTAGFSPAALALAYTDWLMHLTNSPHRQADLLQDAQRRFAELYFNAW